jgi:adenine-specific DNA-methyltransferase
MNPIAQSLDLSQSRLAQLKALFPDAFSEGKLDLQRLAAALNESGAALASSRENYELMWAGKRDARAEIQKRTTATLRPDTANSVNWNATQNLYIEGENLEVLRTLQKAYFGRVKMIYIDPPYNTGNDSFVYPDDYTETLKDYEARTGQTDEDGFVNKQTLWKKNSRENGQFHSVWLSMMYPRLFLARNLLREDGVIFVSIDDNEAANLKLLMDEIFGEENFVADVLWQKKYAVSNDDPGIAPMHDHIFVYRKSEKFERNLLPRNEKQLARYKNPDEDPRGDWSSGEYVSSKTRTERPTLWYPVLHPRTGSEVWPDENAVWRYSYEQHQKMVDENRLYWGPDQSYEKPRLKRFLSEIQDGVVPSTWWTFDMVGHNDEGQKETADLIGKKIFSTPKPVRLIRHILTIGGDKDALVFDFFGGSGTTAQAVLELNEEDGGNRQFICVQMPEVLDESSEAYKAGYRTIADIGRARIAKVIDRIATKRQESLAKEPLVAEDNTPRQALGFNAFKLAPSNFKEWRTDITTVTDLFDQLDYHVDSTRPDSHAASMVFELLLKLALPITTPVECHALDGALTPATVYLATPDSGKHVVMFFEALSSAVLAFILHAQPVKVLCLNKCFTDSQALTNFSLQLQDAGIALEVL